MTFADKILFLFLLIVTGASFLAKNISATEGSVLLVELEGAAIYKGSMSENRTVTVKGRFGEVRIRVEEGRVAVTDAHCPNKVCVRTGWRSLAGESIICVPNRVLVKILGDQSEVVRGITG